ncbi:MAG: beta-phosphoglucomutase family hydrolase [Motiliproteus sp.]
MNFKGFIFDLDGVLVDSIPLHYDAWHKTFSGYGYAFDEFIYREKVDGRPRMDAVRNIMIGADERQMNEASDIKQRHYLDMLEAGHLTTFSTTIPFIKKLKKDGILMAVASSSINAKAILKSIGILDDFIAVVTADDITYGKPHPEIFLTAASQMGLAPSECVVLEDAQSGIQAAKSGNFYCIGVDRHQNPNYFLNADMVVKDIGDLNFEFTFPTAS